MKSFLVLGEWIWTEEIIGKTVKDHLQVPLFLEVAVVFIPMEVHLQDHKEAKWLFRDKISHQPRYNNDSKATEPHSLR